MKRLITIIASLLLAGVAHSQNLDISAVSIHVESPWEIQENIKKSVDSLTIFLDLNKKQAKKLKKALEHDYNHNIMSDAQALITTLNLDVPQFPHERVNREQEKRDRRYAKFLTPEQFDKWKANEEEAARRKAEEAQRQMEQWQQILQNGGLQIPPM